MKNFTFEVKKTKRQGGKNKVIISVYYEGRLINKLNEGEAWSYLNLSGHSGNKYAYAKRLASRALYYDGQGMDRDAKYALIGKGWKIPLQYID